ncbi:hypothetical protein AVV41_gp039 [Microcystis phage MaMV-DC]|uniref:Uncharacterized protein n=1 Tax=Microcystis phage MaMV-DC TaxID=1357715 RepID=A0A075BU02_9CAUD|nr:hypothetical protein AVV41_gp039 [Microcystis phage MaMV-DC]AGR48604.1 hypothetical protein MaMVDC_39 [Microcystis phage MaMV-DC]
MNININPQLKDRLFKLMIRNKYIELSLESQDWIDNLLKKSQTSQVTNEILDWWWKGNIEKGYIYPYLSDDKWNLSFINRFKLWCFTTIVMPMCTGVVVPSSLKKYPYLFRKALTLASIFLVEKSWYKEITDNTTKE